MIRAVVIDDEPAARSGLRELLAREQDVEIVGEAGDAPAAIALIAETRPDLVFLDIELPGGSGFDVVEGASAIHLPAYIFVTAYDAYAVRAFEVHAIDYLLKPVREDRLGAAVARARQALRDSTAALEETGRRLAALLDTRSAPANAHGGGDSPQRLHRFVVREGERYLMIKASDVDSIQAAGNYVELRVDDRVSLYRSTLVELEAKLDPARFVRIHRSTIVNVDRVREIVPEWHGDCDVILANGSVLRLSRTYRDRLIPPRTDETPDR